MLHKQFEKGGKLNGSTYLEDRWKEYEASIVPPEAGKVQRQETKQAFIAGIAVFYTSMIHDPENSFGSQQDFAQFLEDLHDSLDVYIKNRLVKLAVDEMKGLRTDEDEEPTMQ